MIDLDYSLVIEATDEPDFFGFFSPDLEGFTGVGHSVEDCLYKARWGMQEHVRLLGDQGLPVPPRNPKPTVLIRNEARTQAGAPAGRKLPQALLLAAASPEVVTTLGRLLAPGDVHG